LAAEGGSPGVRDKVSVLFSVKNEPGMLYRSLKPLAGQDLDLLKIESRPMRGRVWDYLFFVDFAGDFTDPKVRRAMNSMKRHCTWFKVLGSYPAAVVR
jgi:chorismate mutase/prephenate dehydratase